MNNAADVGGSARRWYLMPSGRNSSLETLNALLVLGKLDILRQMTQSLRPVGPFGKGVSKDSCDRRY